jgi:hypothetical protein
MSEANKEPLPLAAILEHVFNSAYVVVYINRFKTTIKLALAHLFTPHSTEPALLEKGKSFLEQMAMHKSIGVKLARVDEQGNFVGRIFHPAGDMAAEILKKGYSKLSSPKEIEKLDVAYFHQLKQAQMIAQSKNLAMWKDF